jgi:transmembrane sensor
MIKSDFTLKKLLADPTFIDHCLSNQAEDSDPWIVHIKANPNDEAIYNEAKEIAFLLIGKMPQALIETKLIKFKKLFYETKFSEQERDRLKVRKNYKLLLSSGIAASLLLIAGFTFFFFKTSPKQLVAFEAIKGQVIATPANSRNTLILSDGSKVILYPGSELTISDDFNSEDRKIAITGQIYLSVFGNKEKPFIVYSKHTTTTAIGTSFYVRDFDKGKQSSILLVHGKVKVREPQQGAVSILEPGTSIVIDNKTLKAEKIKIDKATLEELTNSKLEFKDADMESIVSKLELFYGVQIDLSTCNCQFKRITGEYSQKTLTAILNSISFTNHLSWELKDQKVVFKPLSN